MGGELPFAVVLPDGYNADKANLDGFRSDGCAREAASQAA